MEEGVLADTSSQADALQPMACSSARLKLGLEMLQQVERLNEKFMDEPGSPGWQVGLKAGTPPSPRVRALL